MEKLFNIICLLLIYYNIATSQNERIEFERVTIESNKPLKGKVFQDSKGFIWLGTWDGLYKFDGYRLTEFRYNPEDSNCINNNIITTIIEDNFPDKKGYGSLWFGTWSGGLNKYNTVTEHWEHFTNNESNPKSISSNSILSLIEDYKGFLWIGTRKGLNKFNRESEEFTRFEIKLNENNKKQSNIILALHEDITPNQQGKRLLWIGTASGLYSFDPYNEVFNYHYIPSRKTNRTAGDPVTTICEDKNGTLWIATQQGEIHQYNRKNKKFLYNRNIPENPNRLNSNDIRSIYIEPSGMIWIGSDIGLYRLRYNNINKKYLTLYSHQPNNPKSLSNNIITDIFKSSSDILWISTAKEINKLDLKKKKFYHYKNNPENINSLSNNWVKAICEDKNGILWFSTWDSGLNRFDRKTNKWKLYKENLHNKNGLSRNKINSIYEGKEGYLWIATILGLNKFDSKNENFWVYRHKPGNPNSLLVENITSVYEDKNGILWLGCISGVLTSFDPKREQFIHYKYDSDNPNSFPECQNIYCIYEDNSGSFWFGTDGGGVVKLDRKNRYKPKFTQYKKVKEDPYSLGNNTVLCIHEDKSGRLWFGTKGGLFELNRQKQNEEIFINYGIKDGLPSEIVCGILEDDHGNLWLSTFNGLSKFNPKTKTFRNYNVNDGLQANEFNRHSYFKTKRGELIFGGMNGFNIFHPDSILENDYIPPIKITDFKIFNKTIKPGKNSPLKKSINETKSIELLYDKSVFSFEFAALDYTDPSKNQYAYKMEGVDPDWVYTDASRRFATYTNLDAGEYIFTVKGSNNDGIWNEQGTSIKVIILPPWWETNWAYTLYLLLFISIVVTTWRAQLRRIHIKQQLKMEHLEAEKLKEVDQLKSRFFANISHEFRTPLTLILGPVRQMLAGKFRGNLTDQYKMIIRNGERLLQLINEILDLAKLESREMKLQVSETDISKYLKGMVLSFSSWAERKKINLKLNIKDQEIIGFIDCDKFEKIMTNLLSNAFKFTPAGGKVEVVASEPTPSRFSGHPSKEGIKKQGPLSRGDLGVCKSIEIEVSNTGSGIPADQINKIFDRFYQAPKGQAENNYTKDSESTGIGLALTKELVEVCRGEILVESRKIVHSPPPLSKEELFRTTFTITLPIGRESFRDDEIAVTPLSPPLARGDSWEVLDDKKNFIEPEAVKPKSGTDKSAPLLMIAEDNPDVTSYICSFMENDYRIVTAENGKKGLKKVVDKYPDLVISDVMMPEMDGFELCKMIKSDERISHIPIILLTAKADLDSKIEGLEFGADDYVTKPFEARELQIRSKNLIEQRRKLREKFSLLTDIRLEDIAASSMDEQLLNRLLNVFEEHLEEPDFSIEQLAQEIGMSRKHLNRKIQSITNLSTTDFIRTLRLQKAARLLKSASGTVTEIAFKVGFNNLSYFSKTFRKHFGKLPSDFIDS